VSNSDEQAQSLRKPGWSFLLWWTLATSIAATLGLALTDMLVLTHPIMQQPDIALSGDNGLGPLLLFACGTILFIGPLLGFAQGLLLKLMIGFPNWPLWVVATSAGVILIEVMAVMMGGRAGICAWVLAPGLMLGLSQSLVLHRYIWGTGWWTLITALAWAMSAGLGYIVRTVFLPNTTPAWPFYPYEAAIYWGVSWASGTVLFGVITGMAMTWLIRSPRKESRPLEWDGSLH
jgi:hypothetical protein